MIRIGTLVMIAVRKLLAVMALTLFAHFGAATAAAQVPAAVPPAPASAPAPAVTLNDGYVLGVGDVVEVAVLGRDDFRSRVQVQVDGTIQLQLIGDLKAVELTVLQLRAAIREKLVAGQFFMDPAVSVNVVSYASRYVTVLGEVATPGIVAIDRSYLLSEIIARVGGLRGSADDVITLARNSGEILKLDMVAVATGDLAQDVKINPGDRIFVALAPQFYIYGEVNAPGSYRLDRKMSLRMALARAGGVSSTGNEKRVKVIRDGKEIKKYDLNAPLNPNDTVVVGQRLF
jgi:polysaccharide biosynthesis/export protein